MLKKRCKNLLIFKLLHFLIISEQYDSPPQPSQAHHTHLSIYWIPKTTVIIHISVRSSYKVYMNLHMWGLTTWKEKKTDIFGTRTELVLPCEYLTLWILTWNLLVILFSKTCRKWLSNPCPKSYEKGSFLILPIYFVLRSNGIKVGITYSTHPSYFQKAFDCFEK